MLKVGADVEHGLYNSKGQLISAIDIIPGTKHKPSLLSESGGALQVDNVLLEWNCKPATSASEFSSNIQAIFNEISSLFPGYSLGYNSTYEYPPNELNDPRAWIMGCDPDFNAWLLNNKGGSFRKAINKKPDMYLNPLLRVAAGHIHITHVESLLQGMMVIRYCDLYLATLSMFLDNDRLRRTLYGKAGAMRQGKYPDGSKGVEYRSLGAFWTKDPILREWVFNTVEMIYHNWKDLPPIPEDIQEVINGYNLHRAEQIIREYNIQWPI